MAILKNKRNLSEYEYERQLYKIEERLKIDLRRLSKRRRMFLESPVIDTFNQARNKAMTLTTTYVPPKERKEFTIKTCNECIDCLLELNRKLLVLWVVTDANDTTISAMRKELNREIFLLKRMISINKCEETHVDENFSYVSTFTKNEIKDVKFLSNMRLLVLKVHGSVLHMNEIDRKITGSIALELVNNAWVCCVMANKYPQTKSDLENRLQYISGAITCLQKLNRPLSVMFATQDYSDEKIRNMSDLLVKQIAYLKALLKSDKKRFANIK